MTRQADPYGQQWALAGEAGVGIPSADIERYLSPDVFKEECDKIFRRTWLLIGRASEVPHPGDFIKRTIHPLKAEVIVVRGKDGQVRAFHNACAHRGAAIVRESEGTTKLFVCPYHAWSYDTEGRCRGITGPEFFPQVNRNETGLAPIHTDQWNGFVFVNLDHAPRQSLVEFLGELGDLHDDLPFDQFDHCIEFVVDIEANWKCFVDAFAEGYHANFVHRKSGPMFATPSNPLNVFYDARFAGPHSDFAVQSNPEWRPSGQVHELAYAIGGASVVGDRRGNDEQKIVNLEACKGINPIGLPNFGVRIINIFPMTQFVLVTNRFQVQHYWPLDQEHTRMHARAYSTAPTSFREEFAEACMTSIIRDLLTEDVAMTQLQYIGLRGGGRDKVFFGENEVGIRHFHQAVQNCLESAVT